MYYLKFLCIYLLKCKIIFYNVESYHEVIFNFEVFFYFFYQETLVIKSGSKVRYDDDVEEIPCGQHNSSLVIYSEGFAGDCAISSMM
jgi:hypothetical protein